MARAAAALLPLLACVHATQHSLSLGPRAAASWMRTACGPSDQVTSWGAALDPNSVLPEYPRPQAVRGLGFHVMNGLWEWEVSSENATVPFGRQLNDTLLVPFPPESCLSGVGAWGRYPQGSFRHMFYRVIFDAPWSVGGKDLGTSLNFGAVDWRTTVYVNGFQLSSHDGGFDGFTLDVTGALKQTQNELIVRVYDPSDEGFQPNGKQRISAVDSPSGDTYVPSSGIWQTVWLEQVPLAVSISKLVIDVDAEAVTLTVQTVPPSAAALHVTVTLDGTPVTSFDGSADNTPQRIAIPNPQLWRVGKPVLYDMVVNVSRGGGTDSMASYFGLRTVTLLPYTVPSTGLQVGVDRPGKDLPGSPFTLPTADPNLCWAQCNTTAGCAAWAYGVPSCGGGPSQAQCWLKSVSEGALSASACRVSGAQGGYVGMRPAINGQFTFLAGWLDQSWWPGECDSGAGMGGYSSASAGTRFGCALCNALTSTPPAHPDGEYTAPSDDALAFDLRQIRCVEGALRRCMG